MDWRFWTTFTNQNTDQTDQKKQKPFHSQTSKQQLNLIWG